MQNSRRWNGLVGGVSGLALVSAVCQFWLNAGTSLPAQTALAVTLLLVVVVNAAMPAQWRSNLMPHAIWLFVLSAWPIVLPSLFGVSWSLLGASGFDFSTSVIAQCVGLTLLAVATLGVPLLCSLQLSSPDRRATFGMSLALATVVGGVLLATFIGPDGCGLLASATGLIAFVTLLVRWSRNVEQVSNLPIEVIEMVAGTLRVPNIPHTECAVYYFRPLGLACSAAGTGRGGSSTSVS